MAPSSLFSHTKGNCHVTIRSKNNSYDNFKLCVLIYQNTIFETAQVYLMVPNQLSFRSVTVSCIEPPSLLKNLLSNYKLIATKSRIHTPGDGKFNRSEIQKLVQLSAIERSTSPWRTQVFVTTNEWHKRPMVVDYSQTINRYMQLDAYHLTRVDEMVSRTSRYTILALQICETHTNKSP